MVVIKIIYFNIWNEYRNQIFLLLNDYQSKFRNHGCSFTSSGPFIPSLFDGYLIKHLFIKSVASLEYSSGRSFLLIYDYLQSQHNNITLYMIIYFI